MLLVSANLQKSVCLLAQWQYGFHPVQDVQKLQSRKTEKARAYIQNLGWGKEIVRDGSLVSEGSVQVFAEK